MCTPSSKGVVVSTSCDKALRVTDKHLIATSRDFQLAFSLKPGDVLFESFEDEDTCVVASVEREKSEQNYFVLNCVHSEVLVSGLRALAWRLPHLALVVDDVYGRLA